MSVWKLRVSRWRLTRHGISASVATLWCFRRSETHDVSCPAKKAPQRRDRRRGTSLRNFTPSARVLPPLLSPAASQLPAKRFGHYQTLGDSSQSPSLVRRARVGTSNTLRQVVIKGFGRQVMPVLSGCLPRRIRRPACQSGSPMPRSDAGFPPVCSAATRLANIGPNSIGCVPFSAPSVTREGARKRGASPFLPRE